MSILLSKIAPKPLVTDDEGRTLTGAQYTFTEPPIMEKAMVLKPRASPPTDALSQQEGSIYYDSDDKIYYFYDGTSWVSLVQAVGGTPLFSPSVDNRLVRFDGVGGSVQDSTVTLSDTGNMSGLGTVTASGLGTFVGVSTDSITAPSGTVSFSGDHVDGINIMDATTVRATTARVETLDCLGAAIDCSNKSLTNVNTVTAITVDATTSVTTPLVETPLVQDTAVTVQSTGGNTTIISSANIALQPTTATTFGSKPVTGITDLTCGTVTSSVINGTSVVYTPQLNQYAGNDITTFLRVPSISYKQSAVFGSTVAGGLQTVWSRNIPAGSLTAYGDCIRIYVQGRLGSSANAKFLRLTVGGTNFDSNAFTTGVARGIILEALISYSTATSYNINYKYYEAETLNKLSYGELVVITSWASTANNITLTSSTGATVNDMIIRNTLIEIM